MVDFKTVGLLRQWSSYRILCNAGTNRKTDQESVLTMKPWAHWVSRVGAHVVALLIVCLILFPILLLVGDRKSPYTYLTGEVLTTDAQPGHPVLVKWSGKFTRECEGTIFRSVVDSGKTVHLLDGLPSVLSSFSLGDDVAADTKDTVVWTRSFILPAGVRPGRASYRVRSEYWCNPLQVYWPIKVALPDIPFNVVELPNAPSKTSYPRN